MWCFKRRDEPVAASRKGFHIPRVVGGVTEGGPQPFDRRVEAVLEVHERPFGPQPLRQLLAGHDIAGAFEHHAQDFEWLLLQAYPFGSVAQLARANVELERVEAEDCRFHSQEIIAENRAPRVRLTSCG